MMICCAPSPALRFQFHNGSIKTTAFIDVNFWGRRFRFHAGSIRTGNFKVAMVIVEEFRCHTGSIKSTRAAHPHTHQGSFNSTMVRLKDLVMSIKVSCECSFNSTMVRLKARKINKEYYTKPALFLQGENHLLQKLSTSGCARSTEG